MTGMGQFKAEVADFAAAASEYIAQHSLPSEWFVEPDHIAIKCRDGEHFLETMDEFRVVSRAITYIHKSERRLGTAMLLSGISIGRLGKVDIVEIMEPKPEKVGRDIVGVEHMEFFYPDFTAAQAFLQMQATERGQEVPHELDLSNSVHQTLVLPFADGYEIKLNNRTLADIIPEEFANGEAILYAGTL